MAVDTDGHLSSNSRLHSCKRLLIALGIGRSDELLLHATSTAWWLQKEMVTLRLSSVFLAVESQIMPHVIQHYPLIILNGSLYHVHCLPKGLFSGKPVISRRMHMITVIAT